MNCPRCKNQAEFTTEYTCDEVNDCKCGDGVMTVYYCAPCAVDIRVMMDCKHKYESEDDKSWL